MEERPWREAMKGGITLRNPDNPEETVKAIILEEPDHIPNSYPEPEIQKSITPIKIKKAKKFFKSVKTATPGEGGLLRKSVLLRKNVRTGTQIILPNGHLGIVKSVGVDGVSGEQLFGKNKGKKFGVLWDDVKVVIKGE